MKKLYNEFFHIPKDGKIREKVMLTRVAVIVFVTVFCLAAMSFSAYAYFSSNTNSGVWSVKSATFATEVQVQLADVQGRTVDEGQITPITSDHQNFRIEGLEAGKWYSVIIKSSELSTAETGYVVVSAEGCEEIYHTQQLGVDENVTGGKNETITFRIKITEPTDVIFKANWGTSSFYHDYVLNGVNDDRYIINNEDIEMVIAKQNASTETNEVADDESVTTDDTSDTDSATVDNNDISDNNLTNPETNDSEFDTEQNQFDTEITDTTGATTPEAEEQDEE